MGGLGFVHLPVPGSVQLELLPATLVIVRAAELDDVLRGVEAQGRGLRESQVDAVPRLPQPGVVRHGQTSAWPRLAVRLQCKAAAEKRREKQQKKKIS
jgi:hypothetical protein